MCRRRCKINSVVYVFFWMVVTGFLLAISGSVWADCKQNYPDSDATSLLANSEYQKCSIDVMVQSFAGYLQDEHRLFVALRSVYESRLQKAVENTDLDSIDISVRLEDYDNKLKELSAIGEALVLWVEQIRMDADSNGEIYISKERKDALEQELERYTGCSRSLKRKIKRASDELTDEEKMQFCKLDFYLRVCEGLNPMIKNCL